MYGKLDTLFRRFIYFTEDGFYTLSIIFVIFTHLFEIFDEVPYINILGRKGSGKSRLGIILFGLCFTSIKSDNISDAALYRAIKEKPDGTTMIIDEADALSASKRGSILLNILRSGYRRDGNVLRTGPGGITESFPTYSPKVIINEKGIDNSALESRTIPVHMIKTNRRLDKFRFKKVEEEFKELKKLIKSFCDDYRDLVSGLYFSFQGVDGISERDEEVMAPIIIIGDLLAVLLDKPSIKEEMRTLAKNTILERQRNQLIGNRELQILLSTRDFLQEKKALNSEGLYVAEDLRNYLRVSLSIPGLSTEAVGRILNRNGIIKEVQRPNLNVSEGGLIKKVQKTCYVLNREVLLELTNEFF
jgi:hypothetical protein